MSIKIVINAGEIKFYLSSLQSGALEIMRQKKELVVNQKSLKKFI